MIKVTFFHPRYCEDTDVVADSSIDISNNTLHFWSGVQEYALPISLVRFIEEVDI